MAIFIPKKINVGYQNRNDTYTGKLAYVIYYDEKGKLRKEKSWNSWRNTSIDNNEYDNEPTEGFVLNKKVGDYCYSWGEHRQAYCRIYDPRGFEFEITVENLLFILQNCSCTKGKGLEGKFVYSWDSKDLILLPVDSPDYKEINDYSDLMRDNPIMAKELVVGRTYLMNDNKTELVYLGKYNCFCDGYEWEDENGIITRSKNLSDIPRINDNNSRYSWDYKRIPYKKANDIVDGKQFVFCEKGRLDKNDSFNFSQWYCDCETYKGLENKYGYSYFKSVTRKFIKCINDECDIDYAEMDYGLNFQKTLFSIDNTKDKYV